LYFRDLDMVVDGMADFDVAPFDQAEHFCEPRDNMLAVLQRAMPHADLHWTGPHAEGETP